MSELPPPTVAPRRRGWPRIVAIVVGSLALCIVLSVIAAFAVLAWLVHDEALGDPPPPDEYFTAAEVGTRGDESNRGERFGDRYACEVVDGDEESCPDVQERGLGEAARLSSFTVAVDSVERVPAAELVDGYDGELLRISVRLFNRAEETRRGGGIDFWVEDESGNRIGPNVVAAEVLPGDAELDSGAELAGDVYIYVGDLDEELFIRYDAHDASAFDVAFAVWAVPPAA